MLGLGVPLGPKLAQSEPCSGHLGLSLAEDHPATQAQNWQGMELSLALALQYARPHQRNKIMKRGQKGQRFKPESMCPQLYLCPLVCETVPHFCLSKFERVPCNTRGPDVHRAGMILILQMKTLQFREVTLVQSELRLGLGLCPQPLLSTPWCLSLPRQLPVFPSVPLRHIGSAGKVLYPAQLVNKKT